MGSLIERLVGKVVTDKVNKERMNAFKRVGTEAHGQGCGCGSCQNRAVNDANYWLDDDAEVMGIERGYRFGFNRKGEIVKVRNEPDPNEQQGNSEQS